MAVLTNVYLVGVGYTSHMYEVLIGEICAVVVAIYAIYALDKYILSNHLSKQADNLQRKINMIPRDAWAKVRNPSEYVTEGIGEMGIEGIMNELGIDPGILKNPLVKGLVDKYAPRILDQLAKKPSTGEKAETGLL